MIMMIRDLLVAQVNLNFKPDSVEVGGPRSRSLIPGSI